MPVIRFLTVAYASAILSLSTLAYAGEPVREIKPLAKNNAPSSYSPRPATTLKEVTVTARPIDESKLRKIATSHSSSIPWTKRASCEFERMTPEHMRISGVSVFHVDPRRFYHNSQK
ncbi:MAG: hypothetical protein AABW80_02610 [Nanoarchaeota archaeon]